MIIIIVKSVLNDFLTVKNATMMEPVKNIKSVRMNNIEYYKHKNVFKSVKIIT